MAPTINVAVWCMYGDCCKWREEEKCVDQYQVSMTTKLSVWNHDNLSFQFQSISNFKAAQTNFLKLEQFIFRRSEELLDLHVSTNHSDTVLVYDHDFHTNYNHSHDLCTSNLYFRDSLSLALFQSVI